PSRSTLFPYTTLFRSRVKRIRTNLDELVLTKDDVIVEGESGQDLYQVEDYDRKIIVDQRTELVANAILQNINPLEKTIVFCENRSEEHTSELQSRENL